MPRGHVRRGVLGVPRQLRNFPAGRLALVQGDIERISFPDQRFDAIFRSHLLEHVLDDRAVSSETRRLPRGDGRAILAVPHKYPPQHRAAYAVLILAGARLGADSRPAPLARALVGRCPAPVAQHPLAWLPHELWGACDSAPSGRGPGVSGATGRPGWGATQRHRRLTARVGPFRSGHLHRRARATRARFDNLSQSLGG